MMDPVTLPMTIAELRVSGAPILVVRADGHTVSGVFLAHDVDGWCAVFFDNAVWLAAVGSCALDLAHPNGERIADLVLRPGPPTADRETLEGIRDAVLRAVSS